MGIGAGLIYLPAVAVQAHHWKARRAFAMGIVITGAPITCMLWLNIKKMQDLLSVASCTPSCSIIFSIVLLDLLGVSGRRAS